MRNLVDKHDVKNFKIWGCETVKIQNKKTLFLDIIVVERVKCLQNF